MKRHGREKPLHHRGTEAQRFRICVSAAGSR
jgi:hypothetical protein